MAGTMHPGLVRGFGVESNYYLTKKTRTMLHKVHYRHFQREGRNYVMVQHRAAHLIAFFATQISPAYPSMGTIKDAIGLTRNSPVWWIDEAATAETPVVIDMPQNTDFVHRY